MIGDNIYRIMKEQKLTQSKLAKMSGISQATISAIIHGASPKKQTAEALAEALHVSVDELTAENTSFVLKCPQCGSKAVMEFLNYADGSCRIHCGFCGVDTGDQQSRALAVRMFESFRKASAEKRKGKDACRVLTLDELLDVSAYDGESVRPVWFENRGLFIVPSLLQNGIAEREMGLVRVEWHSSFGAKSFMINQYGAWWRCWTSKPTQEQSDAIPWIES